VRRLALALAVALLATGTLRAEHAVAGGPPDIGIRLSKAKGESLSTSVRINLAEGKKRTVRMKFVSLTGTEEAGYFYEDTTNYPHNFKTRYYKNNGVDITDEVKDGGYDITVPAEGAKRFLVKVKRKPTSDAEGCVSPRVFELFEGIGIDPESGYIGINKDPGAAECAP
jgi:hypothetical protein